jgi:hypothetical protein
VPDIFPFLLEQNAYIVGSLAVGIYLFLSKLNQEFVISFYQDVKIKQLKKAKVFINLK